MADVKQRNGFLGFIRVLWRGINITRQAILNLIFFGLLLIIILAAARRPLPLQDKTVLVLQPKGQIVEQYSVDPAQRVIAKLSGAPMQQVQLRDLLMVLKHAASDTHISAVLLDTSDLQTGTWTYASLRQVGHALDEFETSGKPVIAWASGYDQGQYYLAMHANRVLLDPAGSVLFTGFDSYQPYFKDLLDKLGVNVHLFRVGEFKSAAEPFLLNGPSPAAQEADGYWLGGLWNQWLDSVAKARKLTPARVKSDIDNMPQGVAAANGDLAKMALREHFVDGLATRAQVVAELRKLSAPEKDGHGFRGIGFSDYLARIQRAAPKLDNRPEIAVVVAEGDIISGPQKPGSIGGTETARLIREARENKHVKAIVLRVNSPGGAVYPAELIRREVQLARAAGKPVVASMGNVAASGGYWISMDANQIVAEPDTITGSIGIFGLYYNIPDTLAKIGIHTGGVATTPWAGAFDITRPLDPKLGATIQQIIDNGYMQFVGGVAKARGKTFEQINAIAQGRVWTGRQAYARGLVDKLGGINTAIALAAQDARLGKDYRVHYIGEPMSPFERVLMGFGDSALASIAIHHGFTLPPWLASFAPRVAGPLQMLQNAQPGKVNAYAYCFCGR